VALHTCWTKLTLGVQISGDPLSGEDCEDCEDWKRNAEETSEETSNIFKHLKKPHAVDFSGRILRML